MDNKRNYNSHKPHSYRGSKPHYQNNQHGSGSYNKHSNPDDNFQPYNNICFVNTNPRGAQSYGEKQGQHFSGNSRPFVSGSYREEHGPNFAGNNHAFGSGSCHGEQQRHNFSDNNHAFCSGSYGEQQRPNFSGNSRVFGSGSYREKRGQNYSSHNRPFASRSYGEERGQHYSGNNSTHSYDEKRYSANAFQSSNFSEEQQTSDNTPQALHKFNDLELQKEGCDEGDDDGNQVDCDNPEPTNTNDVSAVSCSKKKKRKRKKKNDNPQNPEPNADVKANADVTPNANAKSNADDKSNADVKPNADVKSNANAKPNADDKPNAKAKPNADVKHNNRKRLNNFGQDDLKKKMRLKPQGKLPEHPTVQLVHETESSSSTTSQTLQTTTFDMLADKISPQTFSAIQELGFTKLTEIQARSIPYLLSGRDLNGAAKTGSGKTLAFLIPAIELLAQHNFTAESGTGCFILTPTRELAMQIEAVLCKLLKHHDKLTYGLVIGGIKKTIDSVKIQGGLNIIIATPGRLLDNLINLEGFHYANLKMLILDEADRLLDMGFEYQLKQIMAKIPKTRQTVLFSATPTLKLADLIKISFQQTPIYVGVDDQKESATVSGLEQGYIICPIEKRFLVLFTFLKKNRNKKVMVFFKTFKSLKFYQVLLDTIGLPVSSIFGKMKQNKRASTFSSFIEAKEQTLLCTDVAARGLDIPSVDWIVQFDPPDDHKEYIHRVGRTARGEGGTGKALIFLQPSEKEFLFILKQAKVEVNEFEFSLDSVVDITPQIIGLVESTPDIMKLAKRAYKAYIKCYGQSSLKHIFDPNNIDILKAGLSFGLTAPPQLAGKKFKRLERNQPRLQHTS